MHLLRRGSALCLCASLIWLSPGPDFYQAWAQQAARSPGRLGRVAPWLSPRWAPLLREAAWQLSSAASSFPQQSRLLEALRRLDTENSPERSQFLPLVEHLGFSLEEFGGLAPAEKGEVLRMAMEDAILEIEGQAARLLQGPVQPAPGFAPEDRPFQADLLDFYGELYLSPKTQERLAWALGQTPSFVQQEAVRLGVSQNNPLAVTGTNGFFFSAVRVTKNFLLDVKGWSREEALRLEAELEKLRRLLIQEPLPQGKYGNLRFLHGRLAGLGEIKMGRSGRDHRLIFRYRPRTRELFMLRYFSKQTLGDRRRMDALLEAWTEDSYLESRLSPEPFPIRGFLFPSPRPPQETATPLSLSPPVRGAVIPFFLKAFLRLFPSVNPAATATAYVVFGAVVEEALFGLLPLSLGSPLLSSGMLHFLFRLTFLLLHKPRTLRESAAPGFVSAFNLLAAFAIHDPPYLLFVWFVILHTSVNIIAIFASGRSRLPDGLERAIRPAWLAYQLGARKGLLLSAQKGDLQAQSELAHHFYGKLRRASAPDRSEVAEGVRELSLRFPLFRRLIWEKLRNSFWDPPEPKNSTLTPLPDSIQWEEQEKEKLKAQMPTLWSILHRPALLARFLILLSFLRWIYPYTLANQSPRPPIAWSQENGIVFNLEELRIFPVSEGFRRFILESRDGSYRVELKMPGEQENRQVITPQHFEIAGQLWNKHPEDAGVLRPIFFGQWTGKLPLYGRQRQFTEGRRLGIVLFRYEDGKRLQNARETLREISRRYGIAMKKLYASILADLAVASIRLHELGYSGVSPDANDMHDENVRLLVRGKRPQAVLVADFGAFFKEPLNLGQRRREALRLLRPAVWGGLSWRRYPASIYPEVMRRLEEDIPDPKKRDQIVRGELGL